MAEVTLENVVKVYPDGTEAVSDLSLEIANGELVVFVGPSGCGKTTLLRMIAGLEEITSGTIRIGERVVNKLPPRERDVAMVFQNYALYPHKSVYDNLAFPLRLRKLAKAELEQRVRRIARLLELEEHLQRRRRYLAHLRCGAPRGHARRDRRPSRSCRPRWAEGDRRDPARAPGGRGARQRRPRGALHHRTRPPQ